MGHIKEWEELTISDNFLFQKVMQNGRICKRLIEKLPGIKVKHFCDVAHLVIFPRTGELSHQNLLGGFSAASLTSSLPYCNIAG